MTTTTTKKFKVGQSKKANSQYLDTYYPVLQRIGGKWVEVEGYETKEYAQASADYWNTQRQEMTV